MELFILYLWLKLNAIAAGFSFLFVASIIVLLAGLFIQEVCLDKGLYTYWKRTVAAILIFGSISLLLPSKTDTAILVGAHYALKVAETPEAAKVMTLLRQKANDLLDEELNKTTKRVEQK